MKMKMFVLGVAILLAAGASTVFAAPEKYPSKTIEIYCPYVAGSSMDNMARLFADIAPKYTGQSMVVVNKPGASGSLTAAEVIKGKPDGYKIAQLANMFFASTMNIQKVPFNPDDLVPIGNFMEYRLGMAVKADSPYKTLNDLLQDAKKNTGSLKWGHPGRGTSLHTVALSIFKKTGVQAIDVPYKGSPEVLAALLGGHINAASLPYGTVRENVRAGQIRYLTFYSNRRFADQPKVPNIVESGFPDAAKFATFVALFVHKDTPEHIKKYLTQLGKQVYDDPRFRKLVDVGGEDPVYGDPEFVKESIKKAEEVSVPLLKELGLYIGK
jgi:tripartite-type tricarboxylate transporter receptor subunit TctC